MTTTPQPEKKKGGCTRNLLIGVSVVLVLFCIIGAFASRGQSNSAIPRDQAQALSTPAGGAPVITDDGPTATAEGPTNTPAPTGTPEPTDIPEPPTATPVPPTPVPPIELTGSGQTVTDPITLPAQLSRITFSHDGSRNFIVHAFKADGDEESLANKIGPYQGIRTISADGPVYFEINADGAWSLFIESMPIEAGANRLTGTGDYASGLFNPENQGPVPYTFTHSGESNFIVHLYCAGGADSVQNEIGPVDAQAVVRFSEGPCFWEIQADGDWTLAPK